MKLLLRRLLFVDNTTSRQHTVDGSNFCPYTPKRVFLRLSGDERPNRFLSLNIIVVKTEGLPIRRNAEATVYRP